MNRMTTFSGLQVDPLNLRVKDIAWTDICCVLPRIPRFNGHSMWTYSVAEHSLLVARHCKTRDAMRWGLMHDVAEIYLHDVPTPLKRRLLCQTSSIGVNPGQNICVATYEDIELDALEVIASRFKLCWPIPDEVWENDQRALATEWRDLMASAPCPTSAKPFDRRLRPMSASDVRERFNRAAHWLIGEELLRTPPEYAEAAE